MAWLVISKKHFLKIKQNRQTLKCKKILAQLFSLCLHTC